MALTGIADAEQLAELARLLNEFSIEAGIKDDVEERERFAVCPRPFSGLYRYLVFKRDADHP